VRTAGKQLALRGPHALPSQPSTAVIQCALIAVNLPTRNVVIVKLCPIEASSADEIKLQN
jgi:hypothetical protein